VYVDDGSRLDLKADRLLILVHGYQNAPSKAREAFETFRRNLRAAVGTTRPYGAVWGFLWPGDDSNTLISIASYAVRVEPAQTAGVRLAEFLRTLESSQRVRLVGHSLGCRVVLETLRELDRLQADAGAQVDEIFLLAAAVPEPMCRHADGYPPPNSSRREHVFYSARDTVLRWGFRRGQRGAHQNERGEAVGLRGLPDGRWQTPRTDTRLRHGQYWRSRVVAAAVADRLTGLTRLPSERARAEAAITDVRRALPERWLRERRVSTRWS
jgi:esterase/lipase superfamily enzyme